jgi:hypothetical protein
MAAGAGVCWFDAALDVVDAHALHRTHVCMSQLALGAALE